MSQDNVEIVRRAIEAATRTPKPDYATVNALFHPDHEYVSRIEALEGGSRRGASGYREWLSDAHETIDWVTALGEVTDIDDERVLAVLPTSIRGKRSGIELDDVRLGCIVTLRAGVIVRTETYASPEEALKRRADGVDGRF